MSTRLKAARQEMEEALITMDEVEARYRRIRQEQIRYEAIPDAAEQRRFNQDVDRRIAEILLALRVKDN